MSDAERRRDHGYLVPAVAVTLDGAWAADRVRRRQPLTTNSTLP